MIKTSTLIIGGGASGILAAIAAKRKGRSVIICERMPKIGKKILASGNGRCNLLNEKLDSSFYNNDAKNLVGSVFAKYGKKELLRFFRELGLETRLEEGRIFPVTNQASSVLKVLELEMTRLGIPVELNFEVNNISRAGGKFSIKARDGEIIECERLVIASGGKSYPALGSDGSLYELAIKLGHKLIKPVPAAVPLVAKDRFCHLLQGQKILAAVKAIIDGREGHQVDGDLILTKYGLSGTSIFDISEEISIAMNRDNKTNVFVSVDMVPFLKSDELEAEISKRMKRAYLPEDLTAGILPNKFGIAMKESFINTNPKNITGSLKKKLFKIEGTRGWNEAEFTSGGIDIRDINEATLESKIVKNLYFAGEILDVCGKRGGYNLAWAWASGLAAGEA